MASRSCRLRGCGTCSRVAPLGGTVGCFERDLFQPLHHEGSGRVTGCVMERLLGQIAESVRHARRDQHDFTGSGLIRTVANGVGPNPTLNDEYLFVVMPVQADMLTRS